MVDRLENDVVFLRPMVREDTELIIKWRNSEPVRKNFIYQELFTKESHEKWIESMVETGKVDQFIICDKRDSDKPVGSIYIRDIDSRHHKAEYGIFIGEDSARGRGIGTEAARLMLKYCFEEKGLHRVYLRVLANNLPAIRSYEKVGFEKEALLRDDVCIDGAYRDVILMGIINPNEI